MPRNNTYIDMSRTESGVDLEGKFVKHRRNTTFNSYQNHHLNNHSSVAHNILT